LKSFQQRFLPPLLLLLLLSSDAKVNFHWGQAGKRESSPMQMEQEKRKKDCLADFCQDFIFSAATKKFPFIT
jgi:hypothetical protein